MHAHVHHVCTCNRWTLVTKYMHFFQYMSSQKHWRQFGNIIAMYKVPKPLFQYSPQCFFCQTNEWTGDKCEHVATSQMISHHTFCNSTKVVFVGGLGRLTSEWQKPKQTSSTQAQLAGCLPWCISWPIMPFFFHALCKWRNSASVSATPDNTILKN